LQSYNIQWHYKPGPENKVADALSGYPVKNPVLVATTIAASAQHHKRIRKMVQESLLERIAEGYQHDPWFADATNTQPLTKVKGLYMLKDTVVIPDYDGLRTDIIKECHDTPFSGHPGRDKTTNLVQRLFWWPTLAMNVARYVKHCPSCQLVKSTNQLPAGLLQPLPVPGEPWQSVSMDFVTDLPQTLSGFDCITVYVDRLTKMVHLTPSKKTDTAKEVADAFIKEVFRLHGMPTQLVTDRGSVFTSAFWRECMQQLGTQQAMSSAYHPQTDGNTERVNRVMEDMLRHFVMSDHTKWDKLLPLVEFAINNSYHESIQTTPFLLNYGRTPNTPLRSVLASLGRGKHAPGVQQFMAELQEAQRNAKVCLEAAQQRQKAYADRNRQHVTFELGDKVCLSTKNIKVKMVGSPKLLPQFVGPFTVIGKINDVAYKLGLPPNMQMHDVFHVSLLKRYHDDGRIQPPPPTMLEGEEHYEVEKILDHRERKVGRKKSAEYLVQWKGYGPEHNTWEPAEYCTHCPETVQEFWDSRAERKAAKVKPVKLTGRKRNHAK
jgi:transposase InsO family protein